MLQIADPTQAVSMEAQAPDQASLQPLLAPPVSRESQTRPSQVIQNLQGGPDQSTFVDPQEVTNAFQQNPLAELLVISPVDEHIRAQRQIDELERAFLEKHATSIRKYLIKAALNKGLQLQGIPQRVEYELDTPKDHNHQNDLNALKIKFLQLQPPNTTNAIRKPLTLYSNPQIVHYFAHNLSLLWSLGAQKKQLERDWALNCFQSPCNQHIYDVDKDTGLTQSQLTRKYPYYVWHAMRRHRSLAKMDTSLEEEEAKYINLYCSDYIRESIDSASYLRDQFKATLAAKHSSGEPAIDLQYSNASNNFANTTTNAYNSTNAEKDQFMTFGGKRKTVAHYQMNGMSQRPDGKLGQQSICEANKIQTYGSRKDDQGVAMPLLIFKHPPKALNFPVLAKEGQLTQDDEIEGDHESMVATRFSLGRHRQQVYAKEGLLPFLTAFQEAKVTKVSAKDTKMKLGGSSEGTTSTKDSVSISAYSHLTGATTNQSIFGLSSAYGRQQNFSLQDFLLPGSSMDLEPLLCQLSFARNNKCQQSRIQRNCTVNQSESQTASNHFQRSVEDRRNEKLAQHEARNGHACVTRTSFEEERTERVTRRLSKKQKKSVVCVKCSAEYHVQCLVKAYIEYKTGASGQKTGMHGQSVGSSAHNPEGKLGSRSEMSIRAGLSSNPQKREDPSGSQFKSQKHDLGSLHKEATRFLKNILGIRINSSNSRWMCLSCLLSLVHGVLCGGGERADQTLHEEIMLTRFKKVPTGASFV